MTKDRAMSWRPGQPDRRSTVRSMLRKRKATQRDRFMKTSLVLDQDQSPMSACYAVWHWLVTHDRGFVGIAPKGLARMAGWALGKPAPSISALVEMLREAGLLREVYWARRVVDLREAILQGSGPVIVGSPWYLGMQTPDPHGFIAPTGKRVGSHAYLVVGYDLRREAFRILNSWGPAWGQLGRAWVRAADLQTLLEHGEACLPVMRASVERALIAHLILKT